jgi:hypothetical protein
MFLNIHTIQNLRIRAVIFRNPNDIVLCAIYYFIKVYLNIKLDISPPAHFFIVKSTAFYL